MPGVGTMVPVMFVLLCVLGAEEEEEGVVVLLDMVWEGALI